MTAQEFVDLVNKTATDQLAVAPAKQDAAEKATAAQAAKDTANQTVATYSADVAALHDSIDATFPAESPLA